MVQCLHACALKHTSVEAVRCTDAWVCWVQAGEAEAAGNTEEAARLREEAAEEQAKADKDPKALSKRVCGSPPYPLSNQFYIRGYVAFLHIHISLFHVNMSIKFV